MAMPSVIIECAFDNDFDEHSFAQTGYTEITQFANRLSGTLRGRQYEIGRAEAGVISVELDNEDGRFTPGRPSSPYFPNVKANRRFRVRGKNMHSPQTANTGGKERDITGFRKGSDSTFTGGIGDPKYGELGFGPVTTDADPSYIYNIYPAGTTGFRRMIECYTPIELGTRLVHSGFVWRLQGTEAAGAYARFEVHYLDANGNYIITTPIAPHSDIAQPIPISPTRTIFSHVPPANAKTALLTLTYYSPTAAATDIHIAVSALQTELPDNLAPNPSGYHDVLGWNVEGGTSSTVTPPNLISSQNLVAGTGTRSFAAVTPTAGDWLVVQAIVENNDAFNSAMSPSVAAGLSFITANDTGYAPSINESRIYQWVVQDTVGGVPRTVTLTPGTGLNYNARLAQLRNSDGPGATAKKALAQSVPMSRQQTQSMVFMAIGDKSAGAVGTPTWLPSGGITSSSQQQAGVATYLFGRVPNAGEPDLEDHGILSPIYTTPSIGVLEMLGHSTGSPIAVPIQDTTEQAIRIDWSNVDISTTLARAGTTIPHLIPGEQYGVSVEVRKSGPDLLMSTDEGQTGILINTTVWGTQYDFIFTAKSTSQNIDFYPIGNTVVGDKLWVRKLNVKRGSAVPGLAGAYGPIVDATAWEYPKPIFEGWVESWPARVEKFSTNMTISVVDRLKRIGTIELASVLGEMLYRDEMELILPLTDSPTDSQGSASQVGLWADTDQLTQVKLTPSKGDIGAASYTFGVDGPTGETALSFLPVSLTQGFFIPVPYSPDYQKTPTAVPPTKPVGGTNTTPTPTVPKTYTRTYSATWSRTYDTSGAVTWDDSPYCYQGFYSTDRGYNRSLIGFNWQQIRADTYGATIKSVKLTMRNEHWYYNSGGIALIGTHNYSTKPATWSDGTVVQNRISTRAWPKDGTATVELGVTIGNELKAGKMKGISLGPIISTDLNYYGYFRGATQAGRPVLTITFVK